MKKVKISFNAPVTLGIFLICFVVTIIGITTHGRSTQFLFMTYHSSLANPLTYLRFFTHIFGHDGINHFIGNATYLLLLGPLLEEKYGSMNLIKMVCVTAFITGIINYVVSPNTALCGASGIVFAFIVFSSSGRIYSSSSSVRDLILAVSLIKRKLIKPVLNILSSLAL